ncbi:hypothetical protein BGZ59_003959 [Podila verticillata]|nr:hypothetical protein BGZ59_003959 [Podila verticillata]
MDHEHCKNASLFYYHGPSMEDAILNRAAELSKKYPVVILGDAADIPLLKEALSTKARLIQNDEVLGPHMLPHGVFVAPYDSKMFFSGKPQTGVKLVIGVSQSPFTLEGYLEMMATYMDVGESCNIAVKLTSFTVIPDLKSMNPSASEITDADTIPF